MSSSITRRRIPSLSEEAYFDGAEELPPRRIRSAAESVVGGRDHNEDRCFRCDASQFYMVVDGMGGHRGGALASQIAIEKVPSDCCRRMIDRLLDSNLSRPRIETALCDSILSAADEMGAVAQEYPEYDTMGCTLGAVLIVGDRMYFGNIGDCRVYLFHQGQLSLLTKDETLVQGLVDAGVISEENAKTHRWRHIVTNSVSARGVQVPPKFSWRRFAPGERVLITSDGLTGALTDREIEQIMSRFADPDCCVDHLIRSAIEHNARDNVTCVVLQN